VITTTSPWCVFILPCTLKFERNFPLAIVALRQSYNSQFRGLSAKKPIGGILWHFSMCKPDLWRSACCIRHTTSTKAFGLRSAINSSVRAAPDGARRPCSQSCNVRFETPSSAAKRSCESPVFSRMLATLGRFTTRPWRPLLISRSPCKISRDRCSVCP
jgi:hypothetical protein